MKCACRGPAKPTGVKDWGGSNVTSVEGGNASGPSVDCRCGRRQCKWN